MRKLLTPILLILPLFQLIAQTQIPQVATFEDGTKIKYVVLDNDGNHGFANTISFGGNADDRGIGSALRFSHFNGGKFLFESGLGYSLSSGFQNFTVGGMYFFKTNNKDYELPISVKSVMSGYNEETHYVVKVNATKAVNFGAHFEAGYGVYDLGTGGFGVGANNGSYTVTKLSSPRIAIGLGKLKTKQAMIKVEDKSYMGGQSMSAIYADLVLFPGTSFTYTANDSAADTHALKKSDFIESSTGFRLLFAQNVSFKYHRSTLPKGCLGFSWRVGVIKSIYESPSGAGLGSGFSLEFGLGFNYAFGLQ